MTPAEFEAVKPRDQIIAQQKQRRVDCLHKILESTSKRKLIVAGAGTGKTFTFSKVLALQAKGNNLAMTFIRRLVHDMAKLSDIAEIKTFHGYCMKILHEQNGRVNLVDYLTQIIERDAELLEEDLRDFDLKIQMFEETSKELLFYLCRGDYYEAVGFNDAVYRLLKLIQENPSIVPNFDQVVIDEYQDFNPLEVAFIQELEKRSSILIVGDDDQAVYHGRGASSQHLRNLYSSGDYAIFELPFCSRCPEPIVAATNEIIKQAVKKGYLKARISKPYECFIEDKQADSEKHPKIIHVQWTLANVIPKYIASEIRKIDAQEIQESHKDEGYPTVLIIGQAHYLDEAYKQLKDQFPSVTYSPSSDITYAAEDGYEQILEHKESNLGWRILVERFCDESLTLPL